VIQQLTNQIAKDGYHITGGIVGTKYLFEVLEVLEMSDLAIQMLQQQNVPSYGWMLANGATALWETWTRYQSVGSLASMNHIMLGAPGKNFYTALAGIKSPATSGYDSIVIKPQIPYNAVKTGTVTSISAQVNTLWGLIESTWSFHTIALELNVTIPGNAVANVYVPRIGYPWVSITEGGSLVWQNTTYHPGVNGIKSAVLEGDAVKFQIQSGKYSFYELLNI